MRTLKASVLIAVMAFAAVACASSGGSPAPAAGTPAPALQSPAGEDGTDTLAETLPPVVASPAASPVAASPAA
jgi:hypothetical protein